MGACEGVWGHVRVCEGMWGVWGVGHVYLFVSFCLFHNAVATPPWLLYPLLLDCTLEQELP